MNVRMINEGRIDKAVLPVSSFGAPCHSTIPPFFATTTHSDAITGILASLNLRNKLASLEDALAQNFCLGCDLIG